MTMQSVFVLLSGVLLGPRLASYSQLVYILIGLAGFPVFAGGRGGLSSFLSPSFGFVLSFVLAANIVGRLLEARDYTKKNILLALVLGNTVIFSLGLAYMHLILNLYLGGSLDLMGLVKIGLLPFIPGEILKIILATELALRLGRLYREEKNQ